MRKITTIYLHTAADPNSKHATIDQLRAMHMALGWRDVGYHFVINNEGKTFAGRPIDQIGSHVKGDNDYSIGVVMTGNQDLTVPSPEQINSTLGLLTALCRVFGLEPLQAIKGHRESATGKAQGKTCPGRLIDLDRVRREVARRLGDLDS